MLTIGKQLRRLRKERGFTHRQLSLKIGLSEGQLSKLENSQAEPSAETMANLADALGVPMDELRDARPNASTPDELEASLIDAARRVQGGDAQALAELRNLYARLGSAAAERTKSASPVKPTVRERKKT